MRRPKSCNTILYGAAVGLLGDLWIQGERNRVNPSSVVEQIVARSSLLD